MYAGIFRNKIFIKNPFDEINFITFYPKLQAFYCIFCTLYLFLVLFHSFSNPYFVVLYTFHS